MILQKKASKDVKSLEAEFGTFWTALFMVLTSRV
jgi:hypothetical protein